MNESKAHNIFVGGQTIILRLSSLLYICYHCFPFGVYSFQNQVLINHDGNAECGRQLKKADAFLPGDASSICPYQQMVMVSSVQFGSDL